jgi:hypothetical protein
MRLQRPEVTEETMKLAIFPSRCGDVHEGVDID